MKNKKDMLLRQRKMQAKYTKRFSNYTAQISVAASNLEALGEQMDYTLSEIHSYEQELAATKEGLLKERDRAYKVLSNFKKLLEVE